MARTMAQRVGSSGKVIGLDINDGMLAVARQKAPDIEWREGDALDLPFEDDTFDAVVNQFAMMFYTDRVQAIKEMYRVLKPDQTMAVAVWDTLDNTPGYEVLEGLLLRLFGESYADGLRAPFNPGDIDLLTSIFEQAGLANPLVTTITGKARFPSLDAWMFTEIKGWVLADVMSDDEFDRLLAEAPSALRQFVKYDGSVEFASPAHIVSVTKK